MLLILSLKETLKLCVVAQKHIHFKLGVGDTEAEEESFVFVSELLGEHFLQIVLTVYYA